MRKMDILRTTIFPKREKEEDKNQTFEEHVFHRQILDIGYFISIPVSVLYFIYLK